MGSCYHKPSRKNSLVFKSSNSHLNPKYPRQRLSILMTLNESQNLPQSNLVALVNYHAPTESRPPTEGKPEQGSLLLIKERFVIESKIGDLKQDSFDDKQIRMTGGKVQRGFLNSLGISVACKKGLKPESPNQDDFCIIIDGPSFILGVFDGHGPYGHDISNFVHSLLPSIILNNQN